MSATTVPSSVGTGTTIPIKRKASSPDFIDTGVDSEDDGSAAEDNAASSTTAAKQTRSGSELVPSTKPGEPPVTKRTLQNRKAQREFRKRREARVKDLEERCRRFDQMGLEANEELQRVARRFKDENEALRGLLIRLGYGGLIQQALEGLLSGEAPGMYDNSQGMYGQHASQWPTTLQTHPQQDVGSQQSNSMPGQPHPSAMPPAPPGSVNTHSLDDGSYNDGVAHRNSQSFNAPWAATNGDNAHHNRSRTSDTVQQQQVSQQQQQRDQQVWSSSPSAAAKRGRSTTAGSTRLQQGKSANASSDNPLLSLNLGGQDAQQAAEEGGDNGALKGQGQTNEPAPASGTMTPGTFNSLMGMLGGTTAQTNNQSANAQSPSQPQSGGGSAFLRNAVHNNIGGPFANAHRPHQNDALLNPNPIPFALNLSNEPQPDQSWWDRNGGGMFGSDSYLDEKAHAVAQAQSHNRNGSQSPFDIGAFLTTGSTPGNTTNSLNSMPTGFTPALASNGDGDPLSQAGADLIKAGKERNTTAGFSSPRQATQQQQKALNPADHVQTFLRLLERRAIRAGEQRKSNGTTRSTPWMDMGSDVASDEDSNSSSARRSNSLDDSDSQRGGENHSTSGRAVGSLRKMITPNSAYSRLAQHPIFLRTDASEMETMINTIQTARIATVTAQGSASGAPLEVDAGAIDVMLDMLDRKEKTGEAIASAPTSS